MLEKGSTCIVHAWLVAKGELARALLLQQELPTQSRAAEGLYLLWPKPNFKRTIGSQQRRKHATYL